MYTQVDSKIKPVIISFMNKIAFKIEPSWEKELKQELSLPYLFELESFINKEWAEGKIIFPKEEEFFNAFLKTPFEKVKVVIIGQDPYHGEGEAHGLCFSVPLGVALPPSLKNIFKEIKSDLGFNAPVEGSLVPWAEQGVLLLNSILTVRKGEPLSHEKKGWERFTDAVVRALIKREKRIIFLLWGKNAQEKCRFLLDKNNHYHLFLNAAHPSPLSAYRGFLGCKHFSKTNALLLDAGEQPIFWDLNH